MIPTTKYGVRIYAQLLYLVYVGREFQYHQELSSFNADSLPGTDLPLT